MTRRPLGILVRLVLLAASALSVAVGGCWSPGEPVAVLAAASITGPAPLEMRFDLSYCFHPRGEPMAFRLDFGDGTEPESGDDFDVIVPHTYVQGGSYAAVLTVTDDQGRQAQDRLTITVSSEGPPVGIEVGDTAPDFTAHSTDGSTVSLSDYAGSVVLLDFWGAWCPPCRASMPHLDALLATFSGQGVVALVVSTDTDEQDAIAFLAAGGYEDFVSIWEPGGKAANPIAQLYGVDSSSVGIPRTFLIDRQGVIRHVEHPLDITESMVAALL